MSSHVRLFELSEAFSCRVHSLYVKIIKQIQANNKQYKFQADLYKYHNAFNIEDYFMIQIIPKEYPLKITKRF
jgi:hypothetical protein